ncbi:MAG: hypothetical protein AAF478_00010 [Pseudomonadota bacterium]
MVRAYLVGFWILVSGNLAQAEQVPVNATEIKTLLIGNTIHGTWFGDEYKQYFYESGETIYAPRKSRSTRGKWRVNETENTYESWWERTDWVGYKIVRIDGELHWLGDSNKPQPFKVLPGEQLVWEQ